jgi:acyl-CoA thioesterase
MNLDKINTFFENDRYVKLSRMVIDAVEPGKATCSMMIQPCHLNGWDVVQGGAIFTLADFAFAVASNVTNGRLTASLNNNISFFRPPKGKKLLATAKALSASKRICFYEVHIIDDLGTPVAQMNVSGYIKDMELDFN